MQVNNDEDFTNNQYVDLQYFGDYMYHKMLFNCRYVAFPLYEEYDKRVLSNRCRIAGANGQIMLSVPLSGGRKQRTILKEVAISNEVDWQKNHWRSILSSYNSSPWFPFYRDSLSELYGKKFNFLVDWNLACLHWSLEKIKIDLRYELENDLGNPQISRFIKRETGWNVPGEEVRYHQVFEEKTGFLPGLSILDMLFCVGPGEVLKQLSAKNQ